MASELTDCELFTVHVNPDPPVIVVPGTIPVPTTVCPVAIVPLDTLETVRVVPLSDPVNADDCVKSTTNPSTPDKLASGEPMFASLY